MRKYSRERVRGINRKFYGSSPFRELVIIDKEYLLFAFIIAMPHRQFHG